MINTFIGNFGHFFVIFAFVSALVASFSYLRAGYNQGYIRQQWLNYARWIFHIHFVAVLVVVGALFYIIYNHLFEYHYAWSHSSLSLPVHYMISCFWEGQEGSFLLWIFWHCVLGVIILRVAKNWEAPVMTIFALVQAFLVSMILGVVIGDVKIGSSPFILLRDAMDAPIFSMNPDYVPEDGNGLNPLLQNYWMVIHPPVMFLGFALTLTPFAYCMAGLWKGKFKEWVKPALPWTILAAAIIGLANFMGAYWAYETLNFGGYWNWDPVENAIYVPWLVLVAAIHTMIIYNRNNTALRTSIILVASSFLLILYATFLTRSGILGNTSVHSFTDLGMSGQLLVYLLTFILLSGLLIGKSWKKIPASEKELSAYNREFWIFIGVALLCLMGFQVLIPTSIPVYNKIVELFGGISNVAPPADQVAFYTSWQLWFGVAIAILSGTAQYFWWRKMDRSRLVNTLTTPVLITLLLASVLIVGSGMTNPTFIILATAGIYSVIANGNILISFYRSNTRLSGGSVAHIGVALILLGVLFSSGYSRVVSLNNTGLLLFKDASEEMNKENLLLWLNEPRKMGDYELIYQGERIEVDGVPGYIDRDKVDIKDNNYQGIALQDIEKDGKKYFSKGDTLRVYGENTYYEITYKHEDKEFTLFPRAQINPNMGLVASPDIKKYWNKDLYTHVSAVTDPSTEKEWSEAEEHEVQIGEKFYVNDFVAVLEGVERIQSSDRVNLESSDIAVKANVKIFGNDKNYTMEPIYLIRDRMVGKVPATLEDLGIKMNLLKITPESDSFTFEVQTAQKDYVVLKAMEKPYINVLWMGTLLMMTGFGIAIFRRYKDYNREEEDIDQEEEDKESNGKSRDSEKEAMNKGIEKTKPHKNIFQHAKSLFYQAFF